MIIPDTNLRSARQPAVTPLTKPLRPARTIAWILALAVVFAAVGWVVWVDQQIRYFADRNEARPSDAIAVFGAAEYDGRPSPVLRARLDHALSLYQEKLAPLVITLGGGDPADRHSEGGVGHDFLMAHGVPDAAIIAETESSNTEESAKRLAVIARTNGLKRIVVVSDGTHLFRVHALCSALGLDVYTSPRPEARGLSRWDAFQRTAHEILSYTLWRVKQGSGIRD
ncbi:MAG: YdcF family protein [Silvibacterium sp.]